jgi:hypothetical protein
MSRLIDFSDFSMNLAVVLPLSNVKQLKHIRPLGTLRSTR